MRSKLAAILGMAVMFASPRHVVTGRISRGKKPLTKKQKKVRARNKSARKHRKRKK